jgi:hypothetical protein
MVTPMDGREAASCTAAFVFRGADTVYLGYAAHCAGNDADEARAGCKEKALPVASPLVGAGAVHPRCMTRGQGN